MNNKVHRYIDRLCQQEFFGKLTLEFKRGKLVYATVEQGLMPEALTTEREELKNETNNEQQQH